MMEKQTKLAVILGCLLVVVLIAAGEAVLKMFDELGFEAIQSSFLCDRSRYR